MGLNKVQGELTTPVIVKPSKPKLGQEVFDTTLERPVWCTVEAVLDGQGNITTPATWSDSIGNVTNVTGRVTTVEGRVDDVDWRMLSVENGLINLRVTSLPTASSTLRGMFRLLEGGTGLDRLYMCVQTSTGVYAWKEVHLM